MKSSKTKFTGSLRSGVSALAIGLVVLAGVTGVATISLPSFAFAQSHDDSEGGSGKGAQKQLGKGGSGGGHDDGHDDSHDDSHEEGGTDHEGEDHEGGPKGGHDSSEDSEGGKGYKQAGQDREAGGRPIWAKEGLPEIELGRLNVVRSPDHVLEQAYAEAVATLPYTTDFYSMSIAQATAALVSSFDTLEYIDSPLQNLALLKDALDGRSVVNDYLPNDNRVSVLSAMFLGTASDKNIPITADTAYAVSLLLGFELTEAQANALATDAEAIRVAILEGHG